MAPKDIDTKEMYDSLNHSISQYTNLDNSDEASQPFFEELLTIEERYLNRDVVGQGGMKKIHKTIDALTNRPVAKATLIDFENSDKSERFIREARLTAVLEHPNIIPIYDIGFNENEGPYFIMKLIGLNCMKY